VPDPGTVPVTTIDLGNPDFVEDPYPQLRELQDAGPVVHHRDLDPRRWSDADRFDWGRSRVAHGPTSLAVAT
jgi:hypothetical protein